MTMAETTLVQWRCCRSRWTPFAPWGASDCWLRERYPAGIRTKSGGACRGLHGVTQSVQIALLLTSEKKLLSTYSKILFRFIFSASPATRALCAGPVEGPRAREWAHASWWASGDSISKTGEQSSLMESISIGIQERSSFQKLYTIF